MLGSGRVYHSNMRSTTIATVRTVYLVILGVAFMMLAALALFNIHGSLRLHGAVLANQPASALAELRAYYCGTLAVLGYQMIDGAVTGGPRARAATLTTTQLLGLFALARVIAVGLDGPPELPFSYMIWTAEVGGAATGLVILRLD